MARHHHELDALRGLAALCVVSMHLHHIVPGARWLAVNPFVRGHEAVILFFILSGFVLALPFQAGKAVPYLPYLVRRICRIHLPYLAAVAAAVGLMGVVPHGPMPQSGSNWLGQVWCLPLTAELVAAQASLVGVFDIKALNPVVWSLVHEMRMSVIFPLVVLLCGVLPWWSLLVLGPGLTVLADALGANPTAGPLWGPSLLGTLHYAGLFLVGAMLARHQEPLVGWAQRLGARRLGAAIGVGLLVYLYSHILLKTLHSPAWAIDWAIATGAVTLLVGALASPRLARALHHPVLQWLGRVSYSMYLFHTLVLLAMMYLLHPFMPLGWISALSLPVILLVSELAYRWVEAPTMRLGRWLSRRLGTAAPRPAVSPGEAA